MIFMTSVKFKDNQLNGHTFLFAINVHEQRYQQFCHYFLALSYFVLFFYCEM
jgi:hypothetical protein